jgi:hypothetical protein
MVWAAGLSMPVAYEIDHERSLIRTRCFGVTTLDEINTHFGELRSQPNMPEGLDVLLDLTQMVNAPERDQLRTVAGEVKDLTPKLRWGAIAIVAPTDLLFGMSRMFGIFSEGHFANTGVFRTIAEAERWLDMERRTRPPR